MLFSEQPVGDTLLPIRLINEFVYCPRLFHIMYVEQLWADNKYTVDGKTVHKRVDKLDHVLPDADYAETDESVLEEDGDPLPEISRSVPLSSEVLGISGKLDLVSTAGHEAVPVETKRGKVPNNAERSYLPERIQLMAQGLLLREHGYETDHGILYFAGSKTRVHIPFTPELEKQTSDAILQVQHAAKSVKIPSPLEDDPKCNGCSLSGICLPDETLVLGKDHYSERMSGNETPVPIRRLYPVREYGTPLYVQDHGAVVGKSSATLKIRKDSQILATVPVKDISQLILCGNIMVTAQATQLLCERNIPIVHSSMGHWFYGITYGSGLRNAYDKAAQFKASSDPDLCLRFAKDLVSAKAQNQRTLLRRNGENKERVLEDITRLSKRIEQITSAEELLGLEGAIAGMYFGAFSTMFKGTAIDLKWDFQKRNRRPPLDPVNAMLSFSYALLTKEFVVALQSEGLEPWWGLYHKPRHGKPALALDMMEPYRPLIADSVVITAVNTGMICNSDFVRSKAGCMLKDTGRKALLRAFESRLDQIITHPVFEYKCTWRSAFRVQCRLLARWLRGDIKQYHHIITR